MYCERVLVLFFLVLEACAVFPILIMISLVVMHPDTIGGQWVPTYARCRVQCFLFCHSVRSSAEGSSAVVDAVENGNFMSVDVTTYPCQSLKAHTRWILLSHSLRQMVVRMAGSTSTGALGRILP